jgi:hypothetical protein
MRASRHAVVGVWLSGQRRFVPRASTAVNYKIAPSMLPNKRIGVFNTSLTLILSELAILA